MGFPFGLQRASCIIFVVQKRKRSATKSDTTRSSPGSIMACFLEVGYYSVRRAYPQLEILTFDGVIFFFFFLRKERELDISLIDLGSPRAAGKYNAGDEAK